MTLNRAKARKKMSETECAVTRRQSNSFGVDQNIPVFSVHSVLAQDYILAPSTVCVVWV